MEIEKNDKYKVIKNYNYTYVDPKILRKGYMYLEKLYRLRALEEKNKQEKKETI